MSQSGLCSFSLATGGFQTYTCYQQCSQTVSQETTGIRRGNRKDMTNAECCSEPGSPQAKHDVQSLIKGYPSNMHKPQQQQTNQGRRNPSMFLLLAFAQPCRVLFFVYSIAFGY